MRVPAVLLFFFLLAAPLFSGDRDDPVFDHPVTDGDWAVLNQTAGQMATHPVVKGNFTQTRHNSRLNRDFVSKGTFILSSTQGIWWNVVKPFPSVLILGHDVMVQKKPDGRTSRFEAKDNPVFQRFAGILQAVFGGKLNQVSQDFLLSYTPGPGGTWRLGLKPKAEEVRGVIASLVIEGNTYINRVILTEPTGDTVVYTFGNQAWAQTLTTEEIPLFDTGN